MLDADSQDCGFADLLNCNFVALLIHCQIGWHADSCLIVNSGFEFDYQYVSIVFWIFFEYCE